MPLETERPDLREQWFRRLLKNPSQGWHYRLRWKGNLNVDPGFGDLTTTGALAAGHTERFLSLST